MYYQPATKEFFATHSDIRIALNVSFPEVITDEQLAEFGIYPIVGTTPEYDPMTQNATETYPVQDEETGLWMEQWIITQATAEEIASRQAAAREANKQQATQLMLDTDWTELPSVTNTSLTPHLVNEADFVAYRVALRAIAVNPPITIEPQDWPARPIEQWSSAT